MGKRACDAAVVSMFQPGMFSLETQAVPPCCCIIKYISYGTTGKKKQHYVMACKLDGVWQYEWNEHIGDKHERE